jgi:ribosome-associated translation inhibitor RaiA
MPCHIADNLGAAERVADVCHVVELEVPDEVGEIVCEAVEIHAVARSIGAAVAAAVERDAPEAAVDQIVDQVVKLVGVQCP